jgi:DNA excision repair protein ERCC-2
MILPFDPETMTVRCAIGILLDLCLLPESLRGGDDTVDQRTRLTVHNQAQKRTAEATGGLTEVRTELVTTSGGIRFQLSGRADVVSPDCVWEVKTCSPLREAPARSHRLQLFFYMKALKARSGSLLYIDPDSMEERILEQDYKELNSLWKMFLKEAAELVKSEWQHHTDLKGSLEGFSFPFPTWRPGQHELAASTSNAVESSGETMIQAPTGTGKTAALLFGAVPPAVRSWNTVFFLTAKNTQKKLALETGMRFREGGLPLRVVTLSSKQDTCPMETDRCSPEACPLAEIFEERVRNAGLLDSLLARGAADTAAIVEESVRAGVCPFETALCLAQRCDLVICDYNHVFDPSASLKRFFAEEETASRIDLLVDEAGNLPDRVMKIWSPEIRGSWLKATASYARRTGNRKLTTLIRPWKKLMKAAEAFLPDGFTDDVVLPSEFSPPRVDSVRFRKILGASAELPLEALELSRAAARFALVAERLDTRFHLLVRSEKGDTVLQWFCSDPSELTGEVHRRCRSVTAFSATLSPAEHFRPLLGLTDSAGWTETEWPFPPENLRVWIDSTIDTRWRARRSATIQVAGRVKGAWKKTPGTWLAWFPSFSWMEDVASLLGECEPLVQPRVTMPDEREAFLERACSGGQLILAVAGGVFSEGVDMTFPDLRGGFVAGPSLPSVNTRQELVRTMHDRIFGDGFLHAYVIPGMNRVIQAAGRLVRNPVQKADLILLGRRFVQSPYLELLPKHWLPARVITSHGVRTEKGGGRSLPPKSQ